MIGYFLVEHAGYWEIPLSGKSVSRFQIDTRLILEFLEPENEETRIEIEAEFLLRFHGKEYALSAENRSELGPVFYLFGMTVERAVAAKDGKLEISFLEGGELTVLPTSEFESWQIIGARGLRVVCTASGQLFTWQADRPSSPEGGVH